MKIEELSKKSQATLRRIAKASGITPEKALAVILRPSRAGMVTTHLNYGV